MGAPSLTLYVQGQGSVSADGLNTFCQTCNTADELRGFIGGPGSQVYLRGLTNPGQGGQGMFWWNPAATASDDGVNIIAPTGAGTTGRWQRLPNQVTGTFTDLSAGVGTSSALVVAADPFRQALFVHNPSLTAYIGLRFAANATLHGLGSISLGPNAYLLFDFAVMTNALYAISDTPGAPLTIWAIV